MITARGPAYHALRSLVHRVRRIGRRFAAPYYRWKNSGTGCLIDRTAQVIGWKSIKIGDYVIIAEGCWLNINGPPRGEPQLVIGSHTLIGRRTTISPGHVITIGDHVLIGPDCNIIGADHVYADPFRPYGTTGATLVDSIRIGTNCWLGAQVSVLGSVAIGHGSVIGSGSVVTQDVPPFSVAIGRPARVVKRFDMRSNAWRRVADIDPANEALLPNEEQYRSTLKRNAPKVAMPYPASGVSQGNFA